MSRPPRLDFAGARQHVMNRGARHAPVFPDDATCALFLDQLAELPARFGVEVHGYALMPNHYHLMLETPHGNLSRAMRHLQSLFSLGVNELHPGWDGPLFKGRFHNSVIDDEAWWAHLLAYVHLNPVKAHLAPTPDLARWTSHGAYVGTEPRPPWLTTSELLDIHGGVEAYKQYTWEARVGRRPPPDGFDPEVFTSKKPTDAVPAEPRPAKQRPRERPVPAAKDPQAVLQAVCAAMGVPRDDLRSPGTGRDGNPARWMAAWWLVHASLLKHREVVDLLDGSIVSVSQWLVKSDVRRAHDVEYANKFSLIKLELSPEP